MERKITEAQIKRMVNRFLAWKHPQNFNPDDGCECRLAGDQRLDHTTPSSNEGAKGLLLVRRCSS